MSKRETNIGVPPGGASRAKRPLAAPDADPNRGLSVGNKKPPDAEAPGVQKGTHVVLYEEDREVIDRLSKRMTGRQTMGSVIRATLHWADKNGFPESIKEPESQRT